MSATTHWRYLVVPLKLTKEKTLWGTVDAEALQATLDEHGSRGWELVQVAGTQGYVVFKREAK